MTTKKTVGATVTEASVHAALRRGAARTLTPVEERALRMRLGAGLPRRAPLEWTGTADEELAIELRAIEIETWMKMKAHRERQAARATRTRTVTAAGRPATKDKIVHALRRRGPNR